MNATSSRAKMAAALAMGLAALLMAVGGAAPAAAQVSFVESAVAPPIFFSPPGNGQEGVIGVARGDFNGDGFLDLAVTKDGGVGGASVMVMLGNGDGTFQNPLTMPLPSGMNVGMLLAKDFDEDGKLDLMVVVSGHQVFFYKGLGDGTFADPVAVSIAGAAISIQAADLNGDGHLDLVAANNPDGTVTVLLGNGDGTFRTPAVYAITGSNNPNDLAIGDIDGVNGPDIVVGVYNSHSIEVLLNKGDGTFPSATTSINARLAVRGLYVADFDFDGKLDVVVAGDGVELGVPGSAIGFIKGNGDGTFQNPPDGNFQAVEGAPERRFSENVAPDLNGDGFPDVVVTHAGTNFVTVCLNNGNGHFNVQEWVASPGPGFSTDSFGNIPLADGNGPLSVIAGDFNGDSLLDLAVASGATADRPGGLSILLGAGPTGGSFVAAAASPLSSHPGGTAGVFGEQGQYFVALGDFNNDGNVDAVAVTTSPSIGGSLDFLAGRGDGTFSSPVQTIVGGGCPADGTTPFGPPIRAGDIDQDGKLDIAMVGSLNVPMSIHCVSGITVGYGNGDGTFNLFAASARSDWQGFVAQNFVIADFNGDGKLDLAVLRWNTATTLLEVYLWPFNTHVETIDGQNRVVLDVSYSAVVRNPRNQWAIVAGDFDGDGLLDLVAHSDADGGPESLLFLKGNGDGTFTQNSQANAGFFNILDFKAADLNNDGKLDLVGSSGRAVYAALGNGDGTFQPPVVYDLAPQSLVPNGAPADIVDLDGDGNLDLTIALVGAGLAVLPGKGDGTFGTVVRFAVGNTQPRNVNIADLNGDGKPDLVVGRYNSTDLNFLTVLINNSSVPAISPLKKR